MRKRIYFCIILFIMALFHLSAEKSRQQIVRELFDVVEHWMGTPYVYGGDSSSGIDCSAFTGRVFRSVFNINLPRTVADQKRLGETVTGKLQPGDLIFFNIGGKISHVGVYVFDNKFIHAASAGPRTGVIKSSLDEVYYRDRYVYAKRVTSLPASVRSQLADAADDEVTDENLRKSGKAVTNAGDLVAIKLGAVIYRGNVCDETAQFDKNREIVLSVKNLSYEGKHFIITIENLDTERSKTIHLFDLKKEKDITKKMFLAKGSYEVQIKTSKDEMLYEKNITVL